MRAQIFWRENSRKRGSLAGRCARARTKRARSLKTTPRTRAPPGALKQALRC